MDSKMQPYAPERLPIPDLDQGELTTAVGRANAALARYDGLLEGLVEPAIMLSPLTVKEAQRSSKIEGTQATVAEVLGHQAGQSVNPSLFADIQEIINYREAATLGHTHVKEHPINLFLIRALHNLLMTSVRGKDKTPGEFRVAQNWIGPEGCKIEDATFVPPMPLQLLDHLQAWETYLKTGDFDVLAQAAIMHAQFELLHPFLDGNGRIGRLLIPLFLFSKGALTAPTFYMSEYLENHREEYYARLKGISQERDWTRWIAFFLNAVIAQAEINSQRVRNIMILHKRMKDDVREITHSRHSAQIVDALFANPIFQIGDISHQHNIPKPSVYPLIIQLLANGVLQTVQESAGRRPAVYVFRELMNIIDERTEKDESSK
jgi:Fic family protein